VKKIVLDFDGHVTTNSKWNTASQPVITSPPWDTDGDPTSFSERELGQLKAIWSIVAEGAAQQQQQQQQQQFIACNAASQWDAGKRLFA
jgi:hypothetical protein